MLGVYPEHSRRDEKLIEIHLYLHDTPLCTWRPRKWAPSIPELGREAKCINRITARRGEKVMSPVRTSAVCESLTIFRK